MSTNERRAPVQGDGAWSLPSYHPAAAGSVRPGTITWAEHLEVFKAYAKRYGNDQSAERLAERGGFSFKEATELLGRPLETWVPR